MALKTFNEYLNSKGVMQDKPKVTDKADEIDTLAGRDVKPPKGQGMVGAQQPYASDGKGISKSSDKGFGDQGDSDLKYDATKEPKVSKLPTAEWNLASQTRDAILANPRMLEHLVNELRKGNLLGPLVAELTGYRETFEHLTEIMANEAYGPTVCNRFARALHESVSLGTFGSSKGEEDLDNLEDEEGADFEGDDEIPDSDMLGAEEDGAPFDEEPPTDDELEPGIDGMQNMPPKRPMPKAFEHLVHSLNKNFI